jgi:aspartyl aminopeptidase
MARRLTAALLPLVASCVGAMAPDGAGAGRGTPRPTSATAMADDYRLFLDRGRTASRVVAHAAAGAPAFRRVELLSAEPAASPGDRLLFVDRDRSAIFVIVGKRSIADGGVRLIGTHIDTPAPRLETSRIARDDQLSLRAYRYGATKAYQWLHRPLAVVGQVAARGGRVVEVDLGLDPADDFSLWATTADAEGAITVITGSTQPGDGPDAAPTLVAELHRRYGLTASDLAAAELYLVPREGARDVGLDRSLIGAHGQDDRANSYAAWRAAIDLAGTPEHTVIVWFTDREEIGSTGPTGAGSDFLELAYAWLLRAAGAPATEATLARALAATTSLSADTPPCLEANWPEVHEASAVPLLGHGPAVFPFTGSRGKQNGSAARAELVAATLASLRRAHVPFQTGELGRVDEGGGGTIADNFAARGIDTIDIGVCVASIHTPLELISRQDLWSTYRAYLSWIAE